VLFHEIKSRERRGESGCWDNKHFAVFVKKPEHPPMSPREKKLLTERGNAVLKQELIGTFRE
jgi:hypothetical protein